MSEPRNGRKPHYSRIADALRERIRGGELCAGARLPKQREFARQFGVTLMTLRQALDVLEREDLIVRHHGLGTFIASPPVDYDILQSRRLAADLSAQGEDVATRLIGIRYRAAGRRVALALRLVPRSRVLEVDRLRLVGGRPMSHQQSFLPGRLGEEVIKADLARTSLRDVLELKLGVTIVRAFETVSAVRLGHAQARSLGCRPGTAGFESERISYDPAGEPVVFDHVFIPGDRFRITRQLNFEQREGKGAGE